MAKEQKQTQQKSGSRAAKEPTTQREATKPANIQRLFDDAYYQYTQALQTAWQEAFQSVAQINQNHEQAQQALHADTQKQAWDAHHTYMQAVRDAWGTEDAQNRLAEAQQAYAKAHADIQTEAQKRALDEHENFQQELRRATEQANLQERFAEAYHEYLCAVHLAWAQLDVETLDPAALALISQSLASVAQAAIHGSAGHPGR
jgi:hypothetical protein